MGTNEEDAAEFVLEVLEAVPCSKPDISDLPDALDKHGKPVFDIDDKIVIESYMTFGAVRKYLHTRTYRVKEIDEVSGDVRLHDENYKQSALTNIYKAAKTGDIIKMHTKYVKIEDV